MWSHLLLRYPSLELVVNRQWQTVVTLTRDDETLEIVEGVASRCGT